MNNQLHAIKISDALRTSANELIKRHSMKFICWNIAGGHIFRGSLEDALSYSEENLDYFIEKLGNDNADIVVLQETHSPIEKGKAAQSEIIAKRLSYSFTANHPYGRSHIKIGQQLSLTILSKYPIIRSYFQKIPNPGLSIVRPNGDKWISFDVGFLVCEIDYNGTPINVANGHMVPFHYFKRDFAESDFQDIRSSISKLFITLAERPTLVGADFNYNDISILFPDIFKNNLYHEGFVGIETTPGRGQQDHILFSRQWHYKNSKIKKVEADHYICLTEISLDF